MTKTKRTVLSEKRKGVFKVITARVTREETEIYWKGIKLPNDFEELLWELMDCNGINGSVMISNTELEKMLEKEGYAFRLTRGNFRGTSKTKELRDLYCKKILGR